MADDKKDSTKTEDAVPAVLASRGGGFKAWLPLIITIVLMPVLAFGMTRFVLLPQLQKGLGIGAADTAGDGKPKGKKTSEEVKHESVIMAKLLVNVSGTMGARYLLVSLSVVGTGANFKAEMVEHDAQLRDMATGALQLKTLADLEKAGSRNLIRSELMNGFNNILGDASVSDIYFTEFAIQ
jgi:flagellar basal body-associated protein FliL